MEDHQPIKGKFKFVYQAVPWRSTKLPLSFQYAWTQPFYLFPFNLVSHYLSLQAMTMTITIPMPPCFRSK